MQTLHGCFSQVGNFTISPDMAVFLRLGTSLTHTPWLCFSCCTLHLLKLHGFYLILCTSQVVHIPWVCYSGCARHFFTLHNVVSQVVHVACSHFSALFLRLLIATHPGKEARQPSVLLGLVELMFMFSWTPNVPHNHPRETVPCGR